MVHEAFYWLGVVTFTIAALWGLAQGGIWVTWKICYLLDVWRMFMESTHVKHNRVVDPQ